MYIVFLELKRITNFIEQLIELMSQEAHLIVRKPEMNAIQQVIGRYFLYLVGELADGLGNDGGQVEGQQRYDNGHGHESAYKQVSQEAYLTPAILIVCLGKTIEGTPLVCKPCSYYLVPGLSDLKTICIAMQLLQHAGCIIYPCVVYTAVEQLARRIKYHHFLIAEAIDSVLIKYPEQLIVYLFYLHRYFERAQRSIAQSPEKHFRPVLL
jgi:hypothetical protein